jgi:hypothetical protein
VIRRGVGVALALLLVGCGGGAVTAEKDGKTVSVGKDCARASFVPLYAGANVTTCANQDSNGAKRGTIIYTAGGTPGAVLAFYRAEAEKAGLKVTLQTDMNLSASEGKRTLMVMAMTQGPDNQVTVNWGE